MINNQKNKISIRKKINWMLIRVKLKTNQILKVLIKYQTLKITIQKIKKIKIIYTKKNSINKTNTNFYNYINIIL